MNSKKLNLKKKKKVIEYNNNLLMPIRQCNVLDSVNITPE